MVYIVPSMGASAVLLFAVPHSALGQLWNVIGGHLISAAIGVAFYQWLPSNGIAAGASVRLGWRLELCITPAAFIPLAVQQLWLQ